MLNGDLTQLFTAGGISLTILGVCYKAITQLYTDMREDSLKREEKLMNHLDKVSDTLEKINSRIEKLEDDVKELKTNLT